MGWDEKTFMNSLLTALSGDSYLTSTLGVKSFGIIPHALWAMYAMEFPAVAILDSDTDYELASVSTSNPNNYNYDIEVFQEVYAYHSLFCPEIPEAGLMGDGVDDHGVVEIVDRLEALLDDNSLLLDIHNTVIIRRSKSMLFPMQDLNAFIHIKSITVKFTMLAVGN